MRKLNKKSVEDILALTPMQEGMLFHCLKYPESDHYFEQLSLDISGRIDAEIFIRAWNSVIEANEILRAVFCWENVENPIQIILKEHKLRLRYYDLVGAGCEGNKENKKQREEINEIKIGDRREKFNLCDEPPFRVTLFKLEEEKYVMIVSNHHILYDGWSNGIILREFFAAYHDLVNDKKPLKQQMSIYDYCWHTDRKIIYLYRDTQKKIYEQR